MRKYPLGAVALLFIAGIVLADNFLLNWCWLNVIAWSLLLLAIFIERTRALLLPVLLVLTGALNLCLRTAIVSPCDIRAVVGSSNQIAVVQGRLIETPYQRVYERRQRETWRTIAFVDVDSVSTEDVEYGCRWNLGGEH